jgi:hypothetical protein
VLFRSPIVSVELVEVGIKGPSDPRWKHWFDRGHGRIDLVADGLLATSQGFSRRVAGRQYCVAVEPSTSGPDIAVLDLSANKIGNVKGFSVPPSEQSWWMKAEWDPKNNRVAISFLGQLGERLAVLGVVEPPLLDWRELIRTTRPGDEPWESAIWIGPRLILVWRWEKFALVDTDTGALTLLHERRHPEVEGFRRPAYLVASADAGLVLFDIRHHWRERQEGISMLDLGTGECEELTYESAREYSHRLVGWEAPDKLLFLRDNHDGTWSAYRAYLVL